MANPRAAQRAAKNILIAVLLFSTILLSISANTLHPVQANSVTASPGKYDLTLGNSTGLVELSYPNSSILTDSVGDLLFSVKLEAINGITPNCQLFPLTAATSDSGCLFSVNIYIPPEFTGLSIGNIWTSFTNDYDSHLIRLSTASSADEIAPKWWEVSFQDLDVTCNPSLANPTVTPYHPNPVFLAYPICPLPLPCAVCHLAYQTEAQYVRLFQVTSPTTAGRYFFKAFINGQPTGNPPSADNFPTLVVKASRDPATISGTLYDLGNRIPARAGQPIYLAPGEGAEVVANGYTPLGVSVAAQTFINSTADGSYTLFGVAAGTYNLTVSAAGYVPLTITNLPYPYPFNPSIVKPTPITVAPGQSLEGIDVGLSESPNVTGTVLSETAAGTPIPWGCLVSLTPNPTAEQECGESPPPTPEEIYPVGTLSPLQPRAITVELISIVDGTTVIATNQLPYTLPSTDAPPPSGNCVTFPINCATTPTATDYNYLIQNELSSWSGEIPQNDAGFTSGLPAWADYFVRAYLTSYIQLAEIRAHIVNATVETEVPVPLIRSGIFTVTIHFHDFNFTGSDLVDDPIKVGASLSVSAYNMEGILAASNQTTVFDGNSSAHIELQGFSNARQQGTFSQFSQNYGILPGTYYIEARVTVSAPIVGNAATTTNGFIENSLGQVVGLVPGDLYYQTSNVLATIGLGEGEVEVSFPMYRAGGVELHLYSIDTEVPSVYREWAFPGSPIFIEIIPTAETSVYETNTTQAGFGSSSLPLPNVAGTPPDSYCAICDVIGLPAFQSGSYHLYVYTVGYTQEIPIHFTITWGTNSDVSVWMVVNPFINMTVAFRDEGLLTEINSTDPYAQPINNLPATPARVEVFDYLGNFVAANESYIPNNSRVANFFLAGLSNYYGDPRYVWSGFYDTTDQVSQPSGGLLLYDWEFAQPHHAFTIRVWVDGYYQLYRVQVIVPTRGNVSLTVFLDRASRISGIVAGPDMFNIARPQSWATVDLEPNNNTLSGIIDVEPGYYITTSLDGSFQVWVPQGTYGMGVTLEGYNSYQTILAVPEGSDMFMWVWLENYQTAGATTQTLAFLSSAPMAAEAIRPCPALK